jgi:L-threonylcarbamoyladenylate synthase
MTTLLPATPDGIAEAARLLRAGGLVAFPTETVYGLGALARDDAAVAGIFAAKGRPAHNPLIVHCADAAAARGIASFGPDAAMLAAAFWPGPLTLVLPRTDPLLSPRVTAGLAAVALRVPQHPLAQALLAAVGAPLAAPSANPSGRVSPTTAAHVLDGLEGRIDAVLDGGPCPVGVESTILGLLPQPVLLRPGGLPVEEIERRLGRPVARRDEAEAISAPGQLASHYAPQARLRLDAATATAGEVHVGFGTPGPLTLSASGDLAEAAARLFAVLRAADAAAGPGGAIAVAPVPDTGLGRAVNDRLRRAAAPRPG